MTSPTKLSESFVIELADNPLTSDITYFVDKQVSAYDIEHATHFQSMRTAVQFNRIVEGRIVSVFR